MIEIYYILIALLKKLNKLLNKDLKHLTNWLTANKVSLNVDKTEIILC